MNRRNEPIHPQQGRDPRRPHPPYGEDRAAQQQTPRYGQSPQLPGDYPYGVGFSQSQGGYIDRESARTVRQAGTDAYQGVRPWGPQEGVDPYRDERAAQDSFGDRDWRASRRGARGSDDQGLGPDIAPTHDFRGRGPKGYQRSDERLKEDISERLRDDPRIDASEITVDVTGGRVSLSGEVDSRRTKHQVEDLVDACRGVQEIDNRLRIRGADRNPVD